MIDMIVLIRSGKNPGLISYMAVLLYNFILPAGVCCIKAFFFAY
jgi:hypothetical protein